MRAIDIALPWSADARRNRVLLIWHRIYYGISIAVTNRSLDHSLIQSLDYSLTTHLISPDWIG